VLANKPLGRQSAKGYANTTSRALAWHARLALTLAVALPAVALCQSAPESSKRGSFIVILGPDTAAVETFVRDASVLTGDFGNVQGIRVHYAAQLRQDNSVSRIDFKARAPGNAPIDGLIDFSSASYRLAAKVDADSVSQQGVTRTVAMPFGLLSFALLEQIVRVAIPRLDTVLAQPFVSLRSLDTGTVRVTRLSADSVRVQFNSVDVQLDVTRQGRILGGTVRLGGQVGRVVRLPDSTHVELRAVKSDERHAAFLAWLAKNAIPLGTVDARSGFDDMLPLQRVVGDAHVVGLGEATHGTSEFFRLKHRMLEFLVERMGFTVFAREGNMAEGFDVNDYVLNGRGDPVKAIAGMYQWPQNTREVLDMIRWMRQYNADPRHMRKVKFYGLDNWSRSGPIKVALQYLDAVDPVEGRRARASLGILADAFLNAGLSNARADSLIPMVKRLLSTFDDRRTEYTHRTSVERWELARQHVLLVLQSLQQSIADNDEVRDSLMADNVKWILAREGLGTKAVLWAHNGHITTNCNSPRMGCFLKRALGSDMVTFALLTNTGSFNAVDADNLLSGAYPFKLQPLNESTAWEETLSRGGLRIAAIDLRAVPAESPEGGWVAQPHLTHIAGEEYSRKGRGAYLLDARHNFDGILFVDTTTPAHFMPGVIVTDRQVLPSPVNLGFEQRKDDVPIGWLIDPLSLQLGFTVGVTRDHPYSGRFAGFIARSGRVYGDARGGTLTQIVDAKVYRGKIIRLRAMIQAEPRGTDSHVYLWIRPVSETGKESSVPTSDWRAYEVAMRVPNNAEILRYGVTLVGNGKVWIDDVRLDVLDAEPPRL
jgi:erythromycin esterase